MTPFSSWLSQLAAITRLSLETIVERKGASAAAVFGIAGVVAVFVTILSIAEGFRHALTVSGDPAVAVVMRGGSDTEGMSILLGTETRWIAAAPSVVQTDHGPLASRELFVIINLPKRSTGTDANVPLRGVESTAFDVHRSLHLTQGRRFESGRTEVIVGVGAAREFAGLDLGARIRVGRNDWTVVGVFEAGGGIAESEIWTDAGVLQPAYQRGNSFQAVYARLNSPDDLESFEAALQADPRLNTKVVRQTDYFAQQSRTVYRLITVLGVVIASLMALGATFGALNTMYSAVATRKREIATLRALGFHSGPVVLSVLLESIVLALVGGILGGGLAYLVFNGYQTATMNWQSFSQVAFTFQVTPGLLLSGIVGATLIGTAGGALPALRAARIPIATALREL